MDLKDLPGSVERSLGICLDLSLDLLMDLFGAADGSARNCLDLLMADAEARLVIPPPWACGAVFDLSEGIWGLLGAFLGVLGRSWEGLEASWEYFWVSWGGLGQVLGAHRVC